jgi:hypothetical protein
MSSRRLSQGALLVIRGVQNQNTGVGISDVASDGAIPFTTDNLGFSVRFQVSCARPVTREPQRKKPLGGIPCCFDRPKPEIGF